MKRPTIRTRNSGFTIIELLIATAVFSVVLVIVTTGIIQFSRVYYKSVNEANTQAAARNIMDTVSQAIQFGGGKVQGTTTGAITAGNSYDFCIGNNEYSYRPGFQLVDGTPGANQTQHSFVVRAVAACVA